jgi:NAD(P)-dependent dehydrogenase (short-subunit alcohol dehydrogenase family)
VQNIFDISGLCAWVTGASKGGLGHHHALTLARHGANVTISDLSSRAEDLAETKTQLEREGANVLALHVDVSNESDVRRAVNDIEKKFGRLDILVNNAGVSVDGPALEMGLEGWNHVLNVNLTGVWLCARTACALMIRKNIKGKIINIASVYGIRADLEPSAPYYSTKAAVINLTRALAIEWAPHGINVNAIAPGYFPSLMTRDVDESPDLKRRFLSRIPLKRPGDPAKDLAGALIYLASSASDYVTGQTIVVDGGWTATS